MSDKLYYVSHPQGSDVYFDKQDALDRYEYMRNSKWSFICDGEKVELYVMVPLKEEVLKGECSWF